MAGIKVDPPPVNMQIIDMKTGRPTRPFIEFLHRIWKRTGGDDAVSDHVALADPHAQYAEIAGGSDANFTAMPQVGGDPIVEPATTSKTGTVEKATTTEAKEGTADKFPDAAGVHAAFNQYGLGANGTNLANADNAVLGSNNATRFDDNTAAVSGNYPDVGISSGSGPVWWNLVTYGIHNRTTQVATEVFGLGGRPKGETFTRVKHDTWGPWVQNIFASDANFTAMPQVGGDPVVESGSNADGEWTRWADGTQEVRTGGLVTLNFDSVFQVIYSWTFPVAFIATDAAHLSFIIDNLGNLPDPGRYGTPRQRNTTTTSLDIVFYKPDGPYRAGDSADVFATATGRWK